MKTENKIQTLKEYHNGIEKVREIYHDKFKILEYGKIYWNATKDNPITVTEKRFKEGNYILSEVELDKDEIKE